MSVDRREQRRHFDKDAVLERLGDMAPWMADRFGLLVGTQGRGDTSIDCPRCETGKTNKANIHRHTNEAQTFKCFRCDLKGNPFTLLVELGEAASFSEAVNLLGEELNAPTATRTTGCKQRPKPAPPKQEPVEPLEDTDRRAAAVDAERTKAAYLADRGWASATWDYGQLEVVWRWSNELGREVLAVRHPFIIAGIVVGSQDRMTEGHTKWLTVKGSTTRPYNVNTLDPNVNNRDYVHICEGPADALAMLDMMGFYDYPAIAAPGASTWRSGDGEALRARVVVVSGDNDNAGLAFAARVRADVEPHARYVAELRPPERHNDLGQWWKTEREQAAEAVLERLEAIHAESVTDR